VFELSTKEKSRQKRKVVNNENNPEKGLFPFINNTYINNIIHFIFKSGIKKKGVTAIRINKNNASPKQG